MEMTRNMKRKMMAKMKRDIVWTTKTKRNEGEGEYDEEESGNEDDKNMYAHREMKRTMKVRGTRNR